MANLPNYIIFDGTKVKRSAKTFVAEAQRAIIWQQAGGRKPLTTEKQIYYSPGIVRAACTSTDLANLEAAMAAELLTFFPEWEEALIQGGATNEYLAHFQDRTAHQRFPLLGISGEASYMVYGMARRQELGVSSSHRLGVKVAREILKGQRDRSLKTLQALGL